MAIIAGTAITLMTRMQMGTSEVIGKIVAALFGGILLFGFGMLHSVLDTLIMLGAWCAGASVTYLDILGFLWWVIPLNMFGGIVCVAMPRALQARDRVRMERIRVALEMHNGDELANDARGLPYFRPRPAGGAPKGTGGDIRRNCAERPLAGFGQSHQRPFHPPGQPPG